MAARLIDDDPKLAHEHALAAVRHAGRVALARETLAVTAYATGDFALALRELRTLRRITGRNDHVAMIVDSERGVGRPEKALEEGRAADRAALSEEQRVELAIAMSGARLDLGQTELALAELDIPEVDPDQAFPWSPGLFAARAAVLEDLGREDEAAEWYRRAEVAAEVLDQRLAEGDEIVVDEVEEVEPDVARETTDADEAAEPDADQESDAAEEPEAEEPESEDAPEADATTEPGTEGAADTGEISIEDEVAEILAEAGLQDDADAAAPADEYDDRSTEEDDEEDGAVR